MYSVSLLSTAGALVGYPLQSSIFLHCGSPGKLAMSPFIISWLPGYGTAGLGQHVLHVVSHGNLLHKLRKWNLLSCLTGSLDPFHLTWDAMRATDSGWLSLSPLASRFCAKKPVWWIRSPSSSRGLSFMLANFVSFSSALCSPQHKNNRWSGMKEEQPWEQGWYPLLRS